MWILIGETLQKALEPDVSCAQAKPWAGGAGIREESTPPLWVLAEHISVPLLLPQRLEALHFLQEEPVPSWLEKRTPTLKPVQSGPSSPEPNPHGGQKHSMFENQ